MVRETPTEGRTMDGNAAGATRPDVKLVIAKKENTPFVKGRRKFFRYRDLGVADATGGTMRAQVMEAITGMTEPTGWHVHHCQAQFIYVLKGWVELEFEDGTRTRMETGDAGLIPGEMKHNEIATSDDVEILELSIPGPMGTTPCDPPAARG
jgi:mannose-6-phosphate isomerase-like protein (cupin superfamily)